MLWVHFIDCPSGATSAWVKTDVTVTVTVTEYLCGLTVSRVTVTYFKVETKSLPRCQKRNHHCAVVLFFIVAKFKLKKE